MSDQDLRKVTELLREVESEEREKVMEAAEQNLLDSLKSVENITKAIDQLVIKETKRRCWTFESEYYSRSKFETSNSTILRKTIWCRNC